MIQYVYKIYKYKLILKTNLETLLRAVNTTGMSFKQLARFAQGSRRALQDVPVAG